MSSDSTQPPDHAHRSETDDERATVLEEFAKAAERGEADEKRPQVVAAIVDGSALAVVYESSYREGRFGLRRSWPPHFRDDDISSNGVGIYEEISEPPAMTDEQLRTDEAGVRWWGDLGPELPVMPSDLRDEQLVSHLPPRRRSGDGVAGGRER